MAQITYDEYFQNYEGFYIEIGNVTANGDFILFKPYITKFSDNYKSDWNQEYVMGRMDAIGTFRRTTRTIQLGFAVPSADYVEASNNWENASTLRDFLYPTYKVLGTNNKNVAPTNIEGTSTLNGNLQRYYDAQRTVNTLESQLDTRQDIAIMSGNPIVSLKLSTLICDTYSNPLYGYLEGVILEPDQQMGYYVVGNQHLVPKSFEVSFSFTVIHTEPLGYDQKGRLRKTT